MSSIAQPEGSPCTGKRAPSVAAKLFCGGRILDELLKAPHRAPVVVEELAVLPASDLYREVGVVPQLQGADEHRCVGLRDLERTWSAWHSVNPAAIGSAVSSALARSGSSPSAATRNATGTEVRACSGRIQIALPEVDDPLGHQARRSASASSRSRAASSRVRSLVSSQPDGSRPPSIQRAARIARGSASSTPSPLASAPPAGSSPNNSTSSSKLRTLAAGWRPPGDALEVAKEHPLQARNDF